MSEGRSTLRAGVCRLGPGGVLLLLLLTGAWFGLYFFFPGDFRLPLLLCVALAGFVAAVPDPVRWVPAMPFVFVLGGSLVPLGGFTPAMSTLAVFGLFAVWLTMKLAWDEPVGGVSRPMRLFGAAMLLQAASVAVSVHFLGQYPLNALREGSSTFLAFPMALMVADYCDSDRRLTRMLRSMVLALLVAGAAGIVEYLGLSGFTRVDVSIGYLYRGRVGGFFSQPNVFAGYLEIMVPIAVALMLRERSTGWRIVSMAAIAGGVLGVLYTFSRAGLAMVFAGSAAVLFYHFRRKVWVPVAIGLIFVLVLLQSAEVFERQLSFFMSPEEALYQPTLLHRAVSYRGFMRQFSEAPVTGVGWGAREFYWGGTSLYSFWEVRHTASYREIVHFGGLNSLVFNHAVKGGIISLAALLLLAAGVVRAFAMAYRRYRDITVFAIMAGLVVFAGHQLVDNHLNWPQVNGLFWSVTGILCALAARPLQPAGR